MKKKTEYNSSVDDPAPVLADSERQMLENLAEQAVRMMSEAETGKSKGL